MVPGTELLYAPKRSHFTSLSLSSLSCQHQIIILILPCEFRTHSEKKDDKLAVYMSPFKTLNPNQTKPKQIHFFLPRTTKLTEAQISTWLFPFI